MKGEREGKAEVGLYVDFACSCRTHGRHQSPSVLRQHRLSGLYLGHVEFQSQLPPNINPMASTYSSIFFDPPNCPFNASPNCIVLCSCCITKPLGTGIASASDRLCCLWIMGTAFHRCSARLWRSIFQEYKSLVRPIVQPAATRNSSLAFSSASSRPMACVHCKNEPMTLYRTGQERAETWSTGTVQNSPETDVGDSEL